MAIAHETLICERYQCKVKRDFVLYICMFIIFCLHFIFLNTLLYHPISSFQNIYLILPNFLVRFLSSLGFIFVVIYHIFELRENRVSILSIGGNLKTMYVFVYVFLVASNLYKMDIIQ